MLGTGVEKGHSLGEFLNCFGEECLLRRGKAGRLCRAAVWAALGVIPFTAQSQMQPQIAPAALPDSPDAAIQKPAQLPGSLSGTVIDADGEAIAGAAVSLTGDGLSAPRKMIADGDGYFSFLNVPAGNLKLTAASPGFSTVVKTFALRSDEDLETPDIVLPVASAADDVEVSLTLHDMAEMDIKTEEQQRLIGFIPNFYVTYNWNAPPMSAAQKFKLSFRTVIDPYNFVISGIFAGVEQSTNSFAGYGQGAAGFGKRYGASLADGTVGSLLGGAVFPALLRQDPRYFYKGTGTVISRALYALSTAFVCRGDNGKWQPNYSSVLADIAAGAVSNVYYPASDRNGATETIELGLLNAAEDGISNLLEEFLFKHISTGVAKKSNQP
jgi:hypothetical protein